MLDWYLQPFRKYADFTGRAHRREFWIFVLGNVLISVVLYMVDAALGLRLGGDVDDWGILQVLFALFILVPGLAVGARRLHDIGRSGWWQLINFVPFIGGLVLIVLWALKGHADANRFGAPPAQEPMH